MTLDRKKSLKIGVVAIVLALLAFWLVGRYRYVQSREREVEQALDRLQHGLAAEAQAGLQDVTPNRKELRDTRQVALVLAQAAGIVLELRKSLGVVTEGHAFSNEHRDWDNLSWWYGDFSGQRHFTEDDVKPLQPLKTAIGEISAYLAIYPNGKYATAIESLASDALDVYLEFIIAYRTFFNEGDLLDDIPKSLRPTLGKTALVQVVDSKSADLLSALTSRNTSSSKREVDRSSDVKTQSRRHGLRQALIWTVAESACRSQPLGYRDFNLEAGGTALGSLCNPWAFASSCRGDDVDYVRGLAPLYPDTVRDLRYAACVSTPTELVETCLYARPQGAPRQLIERRRRMASVRLVDVTSGKAVAEKEFRGGVPESCPATTPEGWTRGADGDWSNVKTLWGSDPSTELVNWIRETRSSRK